MNEILLAFLNEDISFIEYYCQKKMLEKIKQGWKIDIAKSFSPMGKCCDPLGSIFEENCGKSVSELIEILSDANSNYRNFVTKCYWSILCGIDGIYYDSARIDKFIDLGKRLKQFCLETNRCQK